MQSIAVIILAAGKGRRVGQTKLNLLADGETFLQKIIAKLVAVGLKDIVCVVGSSSFPEDPRVTFVVNPYPDYEMFSSIYCGVHERPMASGYMIFPVDHPFVTKDTLHQLHANFIINPTQVICPQFAQKLGHPIIVPKYLAEKITFSDYVGGLRQFLLDQKATICKIDVADKNILCNINYKSDLRYTVQQDES